MCDKLSKNDQAKIYRAENKPKGELYRYKKRAKKHNAEHPEHDPKVEIVYHEMRYRLQECLDIQYVVDHILPLEKNGYHHHKNLQTIPLSLQKKKGLSLCYTHPSLVFWKNISKDMISHVINLTEVCSELNGDVKCPTCTKFLSRDSFYKKFKNSDSLHISCKNCMKTRTGKWKDSNKGHLKSKQRDYWNDNKHKYKESSKTYINKRIKIRYQNR